MTRPLTFLVAQSQRKGSFLHDGELSILSQQLRDAGVPNDIVEVVFDADDPAENDRLTDALADLLVERGPGYAVLARLWSPEYPLALRRRLADRGWGGRCVFQSSQGLPRIPEAFDLAVGGPPLETLSALVACDPTDEGILAVPGMLVRGHRTAVEGSTGQIARAPRWRSRSNFTRIRINPEAGGRPPSAVVYGNPGCPYQRPVRKQAFWREVDLDPEVTNTRGCAFCDINLSDQWTGVPGIAQHCVEQIQHIQADLPDVESMILLDQDPFPYLPELFGGLSGARPLHLLIQARADLFLKRRGAFEDALALARAQGHRLTPFLVGIENFHPATLELYNKGTTAEMNIAVLEYLTDICAQWPDVVDRDQISPGFILWHPWVTFESLRTNIEQVLAHGLLAFRSELALSKIRLYPTIPFYWRVKQDGLFIEQYEHDAFNSAIRYGYPEETPYRFQRPEAQAAYALLADATVRHGSLHELKVLALILDWVDAHPEYADEDRLLALREPSALLERFRADRDGDVEALRRGRSNRSTDPGTADLPTLLAELGLPGTVQVGDRTWTAEAGRRLPQRTELTWADGERRFTALVEPRTDGRAYRQSARFNLSYRGQDGPPPMAAVERVLGAIADADTGGGA